MYALRICVGSGILGGMAAALAGQIGASDWQIFAIGISTAIGFGLLVWPRHEL